MSDPISSTIKDQIMLFDKLSEFKYFIVLFSAIISCDIFLSIVGHDSILSMELIKYLTVNNIKYLLLFLICFGVLSTSIIPSLRFVFFKFVYILPFVHTSKKIIAKKQKDGYIDVSVLYSYALLEENEFKLERVKEYYKNKDNITNISDMSLFSLILIIVNYIVGLTYKINTIIYSLKNYVMSNSINILSIIIGVCFVAFIGLLILSINIGYDSFWDNTTVYPIEKKV